MSEEARCKKLRRCIDDLTSIQDEIVDQMVNRAKAGVYGDDVRDSEASERLRKLIEELRDVQQQYCDG